VTGTAKWNAKKGKSLRLEKVNLGFSRCKKRTQATASFLRGGTFKRKRCGERKKQLLIKNMKR